MNRSYLLSNAILLWPFVLVVGLLVIFFSNFIFVGVVFTCFGAVFVYMINRQDEEGILPFTLIAACSVTLFYGMMVWFQLRKDGFYESFSRSLSTAIDLTLSGALYFLLLYCLWVVATRGNRQGHCEQGDRNALKQ